MIFYIFSPNLKNGNHKCVLFSEYMRITCKYLSVSRLGIPPFLLELSTARYKGPYNFLFMFIRKERQYVTTDHDSVIPLAHLRDNPLS